MTYFLCGFMGCGKSTIGKFASALLDKKFIDLDDYIEKKLNMKIPDIFKEKGEPFFREEETKAISELATSENIIACGGGAMINPKNSQIAQQDGVVVFLDVPFQVCYKRIEGDTNRPLIVANTKQQVEELYKKRYPVYKLHSTVVIDANKTPEEVANDIATLKL